MDRFNICDEIKCPFSRKSGCARYAVSGHCHLLAGRPQLEGEPWHQKSGISNNQYWLSADVDEPLVDINELRQRNEDYIANDERCQRQLKMEAVFGV